MFSRPPTHSMMMMMLSRASDTTSVVQASFRNGNLKLEIHISVLSLSDYCGQVAHELSKTTSTCQEFARMWKMNKLKALSLKLILI